MDWRQKPQDAAAAVSAAVPVDDGGKATGVTLYPRGARALMGQ